MAIGFLILLSLALGVAAWAFFVWTVRAGQYEDPEGPKYRMLEDDEPNGPRSPEPEPAPGEGGARGSRPPPRGRGPA